MGQIHDIEKLKIKTGKNTPENWLMSTLNILLNQIGMFVIYILAGIKLPGPDPMKCN